MEGMEKNGNQIEKITCDYERTNFILVNILKI